MIEDALQVERERLVSFPVEAEHSVPAGLLPARIVVVARGVLEAELQVVVRSDPLGGVDHASLESGVDLACRGQDNRRTCLGEDRTTEARDAHLQALEV